MFARLATEDTLRSNSKPNGLFWPSSLQLFVLTVQQSFESIELGSQEEEKCRVRVSHCWQLSSRFMKTLAPPCLDHPYPLSRTYVSSIPS
jgi:hypothetical protein